jgi:hypothetical protein
MAYEININWQPLQIAASEAPNVSGVYWLGAPFNLKYSNNISRVFYIGYAKNLHRRLQSHKNTKKRGNFLLKVFSSGDPSVILAYYYPVKDLTEDQLQGLEYEIMYRFGLKNGFIPLGNRFPPERGSADIWSGKFRIIETEIAGESLSVDQIADRFNLIVEYDPYPILFNRSITFDLQSGTVSMGDKGNEIFSINFRVKHLWDK